MAFTNKQEIFINEYLKCWNATEAARRADYAFPNTQGPRLLVDVSISKEIDQRKAEIMMSADEAMKRMSDMARGDLADFNDVIETGNLKKSDISHLVKKLKVTKRTIIGDDSESGIREVKTEIELYDAQSALRDILKIHGKFTDKVELSGPDGSPIKTEQITNDNDRTAEVLSILSQCGAITTGTDSLDDSEADPIHSASTDS